MVAHWRHLGWPLFKVMSIQFMCDKNKMKCHYEILGIAKDADSREIKSAYRKFALKWHPDKNLNNTEFAKEQFQLVQQAYEVLSDPQERAWYDKHREQILRGSNSEFKDNCLDVFQFFTTTCFKGYGDDEKGFYTIYRNVFEQILQEELEFIEHKEQFSDVPRFGDSNSDYDEFVGPFYAYWSSYNTKKSYVWLDPYNIKETRDRRVLKLLEKENKKVRQKAKKERSEEIRNLVAFVRKRDKRVQEHTKLLVARIHENRQKQEELSRQKRLERRQQLNESGAQADWAKFDNVKSELEEIEKNLAAQFGEDFSNSEEEFEDVEDFYCAACNKIFKTAKAFENHESSKKHRENVERLKEFMLEENQVGDEATQGSAEDLSDIGDNSNASSANGEERKNDKILEIDSSEDEEPDLTAKFRDLSEIDENSDNSLEPLKRQKKKNKKPKNVIVDNNEDEILDLGNLNLDSDDSSEFMTIKKQKKKNAKKSKVTMEVNIEENGTIPAKSNGVNLSKKKQAKMETELSEIDTNHCCVTCKSTFQSKNKLFDHLKKTGHGVYLPKGAKNKKRIKVVN